MSDGKNIKTLIMKQLIFSIIFFVSYQVSAQTMTWEQRYENAVYFVNTIGDETSYQIKIEKAVGHFSDSEQEQIENLCLMDDMQGVFKIVSTEADRISIYHLSGMNRVDFEMLFNTYFGEGFVIVYDPIPHPIH